MLRCCCCYLVHALLLTSLTSSSQWSPQRHTDAIILRFHGNKDHVSRRRRSRQLGNRRFGTIDASKSAFVALSRGGADETLIKKVKHNDVDDHKRRLDDALVRAVDEILRRSLTEGTTITSTMPRIDIVYTGLDRVYSNNVDEVIANSTITREYVRKFVDVAIKYMWDVRYRKKIMEITRDGSSSSSSSSLLSDPCSSWYEIVVDIWQSSAWTRIRPTTTPILSMEFRHQLNAMLATAILHAEESLMDMESEMDDCFLIQEEEEQEEVMEKDDIKRKIPLMPLFGDRVNAIVDDISLTFSSFMEQHTDVLSETEKVLVNDERIRVLKKVLLGRTSGKESCVQRLYNLHLQGLRDYFGRRYEVELTSGGNDPVTSLDTGDVCALWKSRQRDAARKAWEGFDSAASASIPQICQPPNGELCDVEECAGVFSFVEALRGLLEDMQDATTAFGFDDEEELEDFVHLKKNGQGDSVDDYSPKERMGLRQLLKSIKGKFRKRGPSRWYERLAAKAFVIGVNYVQGWIVLQTLRRESRRRDLAMPKFPLF